jgi:hypothetical protein
MRTLKNMGLLIVITVAFSVIVGTITTADSDTAGRRELKSMIQRLDHAIERCQLAREAAIYVTEPQAECEAIIKTSEAMMEIAEQAKTVMCQSEKLVASDELADDAQFQTDIRGLNAQLENLAVSLENMLQYVEHMTYRLDVRRSHS